MKTLKRKYIHFEVETSSGTLKEKAPIITKQGVDNEEIEVTPISGVIDGVDFCDKCGYVRIDGVCLGCENKKYSRHFAEK